jgi:ferredoxin-NADP reductase
MQEWFTGQVVQVVSETAITKRIWIEIPHLSTFSFKAGQFVTLDLPIHEQKNKRWRSYSIASHPDGTNVIELVVVHLEGGLGSTYLCQEVQVGTQLNLRGPLGSFTLPQDLDQEVFLICTGTGIAPFRSMVHALRNQGVAHPPIHLIFGTRTPDDLLYRSEMESLQATQANFHYWPTLSRAPESWMGKKGYVHAVYSELLHDKRPAHFYLCGWKAMIDEAKTTIQALGYDRKSIHLEIYG